jgi:DNA-binding transcriptional LysR family regulator
MEDGVIELRRLRAFLVVAEEGHITRAAEQLGMQQPPLTRLLRALEQELGVQLLQRLARGVRPTEAGQLLMEEARAVLKRAAELENAVRLAARGEAGRLAVGFTPSAALHPFVPEVLRSFREQAPGVRMELDEAGTTELVDGLVNGRLDAAFVRSPLGDMPGLLVQPVLEEPMVAALPAGHRLAANADDRGALPLRAMAAEAFILYRRPAGPGLYDAILAACHAAGFSPVVVQEAPRLPSTLSLVAAGFGISLVPASMRRLAVSAVTYRELCGCPGLSAPLHLALRRNRLSATVARFRSVVSNHAAKLIC